MKKKVLITTLFGVTNYGTVLQAYATQKKIRDLGYDNDILNYTQKRLSMINVIKKSSHEANNIKSKLFIVASVAFRLIPNIIIKRVFSKFVNDYLVLTPDNVNNCEEVKKLYNYFDYSCFLTGSDQVWNSKYNEGIDYVYFLNFVPDNLNKVSYASSIGMSEFPKEETKEIKKLLNRYNHISVRELSAQEELKKMSINSKVVLDPTMLLKMDEWQLIEKNMKINEKYLLVYILGRDKSIMKIAEKIASEKKLKIIKIGLDFIFSNKIYKNYQFCSPNEFVYLFRNADFILTNSFHGLAFSINFNKQFFAISPKTYNTRLLSILSIFNLTERLIDIDSSINIADINYNLVNTILDNYREESVDFLRKSIKGDD